MVVICKSPALLDKPKIILLWLIPGFKNTVSFPVYNRLQFELLCHSHLMWPDSIFPSFRPLQPFWPFLSSTMLIFELNDGGRWQDNGWLTSGCWRWSMWRESSELQIMSRAAPSTINHQRWMGILWRNSESLLELPAITGVMRLTRAECWFRSSCGSRHCCLSLCPWWEARRRTWPWIWPRWLCATRPIPLSDFQMVVWILTNPDQEGSPERNTDQLVKNSLRQQPEG